MLHSTAIIHPTALIGNNVEIGPYSIIEKNTKVGNGCKIESHVRIGSNTTIGENNRIFQGAIIGGIPMDLSYEGQETYLTIGDNNVVREYVTISKGTIKGGGVTKVGNDNFIMNFVHIGHDTAIGDHCVFANNVQIAGHIEIEDYVTIGGCTAVHQFCKIGQLSMIGGVSGVTKDIVPYALANGTRASIYGINIVGLKRKGMNQEDIRIIKHINNLLFRNKLTLPHAIDEIQNLPPSNFKEHTLHFLTRSERGIAKMKL